VKGLRLDGLLPASVIEVGKVDEALGARVRRDVLRLLVAAEANAWAQRRLPELSAARSVAEVLEPTVREARALTGVARTWALAWRGDIESASFESMVSLGDPVSGDSVPAPEQISRTVVGETSRGGRPMWSEDALADPRFSETESIQMRAVRSVGCLPMGPRAVLYLEDPLPGRFAVEERARLSALCALAGSVMSRFDRDQGAPTSITAPEIPGLVGDDPVMVALRSAIHAFAPMPWPALILGETGTGKERVARALHELSPRASEPFVPVNCGAIPEQLAESTLFGHERGAFTGADRRRRGFVERVGAGCLFLDEVGELPPGVQVKLLRLLQEGTFERVGAEVELRFRGRILAATHRALGDSAERGPFRDDLYHRLAACVLRVPPLRSRTGDLPTLARHLLARAMAEAGVEGPLQLAPATLAHFHRRSWPGNVRELENCLRTGIARALAEGADTIDPVHVEGVGDEGASPAVAAVPTFPLDLSAVTEAYQRELVRAALDEAGGHRSNAARLLGVSRQWLHRLLSRLDEA
jgi:DNA-binding NtrC family response regulator